MRAGVAELVRTRQTIQQNTVGLDICLLGKIQVIEYQNLPSATLHCQAML